MSSIFKISMVSSFTNCASSLAVKPWFFRSSFTFLFFIPNLKIAITPLLKLHPAGAFYINYTISNQAENVKGAIGEYCQ